jgi:hypothetical protein
MRTTPVQILAPILVLVAGAIPALAQDIVERDASCVPYLTAQRTECAAVDYYRCTDGTNVYFRGENSFMGQLSLVAHYDPDYNLIAGQTPDGSLKMQTEAAPGTSRLSLADLRANGSAGYVEVIRMQLPGMELTLTQTYTVTLDPQPVTIDGKAFQVATVDVATQSEPSIGNVSGKTRLFFSDDLPFPMEGATETTGNGVRQVMATDPVDLVLPGEAGFATLVSREGCIPAPPGN